MSDEPIRVSSIAPHLPALLAWIEADPEARHLSGPLVPAWLAGWRAHEADEAERRGLVPFRDRPVLGGGAATGGALDGDRPTEAMIRRAVDIPRHRAAFGEEGRAR